MVVILHRVQTAKMQQMVSISVKEGSLLFISHHSSYFIKHSEVSIYNANQRSICRGLCGHYRQ